MSVLSVCLVRARQARQLGGIGLTTPRALAPAHLCIIALLAACATTGIKPEEKLVSSVTSLPPVQVPVPVRCVKEIPPMPTLTIDPNATVLQRYYAMKALLAAQDEYMLRANAVIQGCAATEPKP